MATENISDIGEDLAELSLLKPEFTGPVSPRRSTETPDVWPPWPAQPKRDATERTWHHNMPEPEGEWQAERRHQQRVIKLLPRRLRRVVLRIRNTYWRRSILDFVTTELFRRAAERDRLHETNAATELLAILHEPLCYVPGPDTMRILCEMAADNRFALQLHKVVKATARGARNLSTWSFDAGPLEVPRVSLPRSGTIRLEAWCGLTLAPLPHRVPEGLLVGLAQHFWRGARRHADRKQHVLDWGAGNSPFTKALLVAAPEGVLWEDVLVVDEVDVLGDAPSELSFVRRTSSARRAYDVVLIQLPPPCVGRGGYRDRSKGLPAGRPGQTRLRDLARLGSRRWARSAPRVICNVLSAITAVRDVTLAIPLFEIGTPGEHSTGDLFEGVAAQLQKLIQDAGFVIVRDFVMSSTESDELWRCIVAARRTQTRREGDQPDERVGSAATAEVDG